MSCKGLNVSFKSQVVVKVYLLVPVCVLPPCGFAGQHNRTKRL